MNFNRAFLLNYKWNNLRIHKLNGHIRTVLSVCFSTNGATLAFGNYVCPICEWDVKTEIQIEPSDKIYNDILAQLKAPLFQTIIHMNELNYFCLQLQQSEIIIFCAQKMEETGTIRLQKCIIYNSSLFTPPYRPDMNSIKHI